MRTGTIIITVLASIVVVPFVFVMQAVLYWTIFVPFVRTMATEGGDSLITFVYHLLSPFRDSIKSVRFIYHHIDGAMKGRETLHIEIVD